MSLTPFEFTGERFVPGIPGEIVYEHWHRYAFAQSLARGRRVLDVACGEGYGSAHLAASAQSVIGVDVSEEVVQHAAQRYGSTHPNLRFLQASAASLPLANGSVDLVVSFETIEHLPQSLQAPMVEEFARVLAPGGILVLSSPNRPEYSPPGTPPNPFHVHELDRKELEALLCERFPSQVWLLQRHWLGSSLWREPVSSDGMMKAQAWEQLEDGRVAAAGLPAAKYFIVVAARDSQDTLCAVPELSLFSDVGETELKRFYHEASEAIRLDKLLSENIKKLHEQAGTIAQLENDLRDKNARLRYRESLVGWLRYPLYRLRRLLFKR